MLNEQLLYNKRKSWAEKNLITILNVTSVGLVFIAPPIGAILSSVIQLGVAGIEYSKGDKMDAGLSVLFALIPGTVMAKSLPMMAKLGPKGAVKLSKKLSEAKKTGNLKKAGITKKEITALKELKNNKSVIKSIAIKNAATKSFIGIAKKLKFIKFLLFLSKLKNKKIFSNVIAKFMGTVLIYQGVAISYNNIASYYGLTNISDGNKGEVNDDNISDIISIANSSDEHYENIRNILDGAIENDEITESESEAMIKLIKDVWNE